MKELRPRIIHDMEEWRALRTVLKDKGYTLFQTQFSFDSPEGYHAHFISGKKRMEVITYNLEVEKSIVGDI